MPAQPSDSGAGGRNENRTWTPIGAGEVAAGTGTAEQVMTGPGSYLLDGMPPISCGAGALNGAGALVRGLVGKAASIMIVADPGLKKFGHAKRLEQGLIDAGLTPVLFEDFGGEPSFADADRAAFRARTARIAAVIGLGGGSAMDLAKAVAVGFATDGPVMRFALGAQPLPAALLPILAVPTTSGTGSETTRTAVLSDRSGVKQWLWGGALKPVRAILDPDLTIGLPPALTTATGLDALIHAIEAATNRNVSAGNSAIAWAAIRLVAEHLPAVIDDPSDLEARGAMQIASAYAGVAIDNAGTAIAHAIGHALASLVKVPHGQAVASAMAATLDWNVADDDGRFGRVAEAMGGPRDAAEVPVLFDALAHRLGHSFDLNLGASIDPRSLAVQIRRPENAPMLQANWRAASDDELLVFARRVLSRT